MRLTLGLGLALAVSALLPGCDNPACVFGGTCVGGGGGAGLGDEPASIPIDGEELLEAAPAVDVMFPLGVGADADSPLAVVFTESMSSTGLSAAFELENADIALTLPLPNTTLVGDGHVVAIFPTAPLQAGITYNLKFREEAVVADRLGQTVAIGTDRTIGTFTVATTAPTAPRVLGVWPTNHSTQCVPTSEIVVFFTRRMDVTTVDNQSFDVKVADADPIFDSAPQQLLVGGVLQDSRVWRWRSVNGQGLPVSLGLDVDVDLRLSPAGHIIEDSAGNALVTALSDYRTAPFGAPSGGAITSVPTDAIGIDNISGPKTLAVRVDVPDGRSGDRIGVFLFGKQPNVPTSPPTIALLREVPLEAPFTTFTFTADEIDLLARESPLEARLADGSVTLAFRLKRGNAVSGVRLLDVDPSATGTQSATLDTLAPMFLGLGGAGNEFVNFASATRDFVLVGRANEKVFSALVETPLGTNELVPGTPPEVLGAHASGLFVAAPVRVGVLEVLAQPLAFTLNIFDAARNRATVVDGQFQQVAAASLGLAGPFSVAHVNVVDALTLAPVVGAVVYVHEDLLGTLSFVDQATTDARGRANLDPAPRGETVVTVTATGYDVFTFDGIPTDRVSIPLTRSAPSTGTTTGAVLTISPAFNAFVKRIADTRSATPGAIDVLAVGCSPGSTPQSFVCPYGPIAVPTGVVGIESLVVTQPPASSALYSGLTFLQQVEIALPVPIVTSGPGTSNNFSLTTTLAIGFDPEEIPIDTAPVVFDASLFGTIAGPVQVRVEGQSPGSDRNVVVGSGLAFTDLLPGSTILRAAYPGLVDGIADSPTDLLGRLVQKQAIEPDLLQRCEVVDMGGNRAGRRPRLSRALIAVATTAVPAFAATPFEPNAGGVSLDLVLSDVLTDSFGALGIHRVTLRPASGPGWTIWRVDADDAAGPNLRLNLPLVGVGGTLPISAGDVSATISTFGWPDFDPLLFLWSDVGREYDVFAHAAAVTLTPP